MDTYLSSVKWVQGETWLTPPTMPLGSDASSVLTTIVDWLSWACISRDPPNQERPLKKKKKICHVTVGPTLMNELITGVAWLLSGCVFKCYSRSESAESSKRIPLLPPHVIIICHTAAWTRTGKLDALCLGLFLIWNHVSVPKCHLVFEWNPAIYKVSRISFWCWSAVCRDAVKRCLVNINLFTWYCFVLSLFF